MTLDQVITKERKLMMLEYLVLFGDRVAERTPHLDEYTDALFDIELDLKILFNKNHDEYVAQFGITTYEIYTYSGKDMEFVVTTPLFYKILEEK